jgi:hypothetical protein
MNPALEKIPPDIQFRPSSLYKSRRPVLTIYLARECHKILPERFKLHPKKLPLLTLIFNAEGATLSESELQVMLKEYNAIRLPSEGS